MANSGGNPSYEFTLSDEGSTSTISTPVARYRRQGVFTNNFDALHETEENVNTGISLYVNSEEDIINYNTQDNGDVGSHNVSDNSNRSGKNKRKNSAQVKSSSDVSLTPRNRISNKPSPTTDQSRSINYNSASHGISRRRTTHGGYKNKDKQESSNLNKNLLSISRSLSLCSADNSTTINSYNNSNRYNKSKRMSSLSLYPPTPGGYSSPSSSVCSVGERSSSANSDIWNEFEDYIASIDTDSIHFQTKQSTSKGSETFKCLLEEEWRKKNGFPTSAMTALRVNRFKENILTHTVHEMSNVHEEQSEQLPQPSLISSTTEHDETTSHAWNKVKIDVQERHLEKVRSEPTGSGWKLISTTAPLLTDAEKARRILYERYIEKPHAWLEGLQNYHKYKYIFEENEENRNHRGANQYGRNNTHQKANSDSAAAATHRPKTTVGFNRTCAKKRVNIKGNQDQRPFTAFGAC